MYRLFDAEEFLVVTVSASEYRANLKRWHERARSGEDVVVTDNGEPTVRVTAAGGEALLVRWERDGLLRPSSRRRPATEIVSFRANGDSADVVSSQRDR